MTLTFIDVGFRFTPSQPLIESLSFEAAAGHVTAITGPSGSGKSTVLFLAGLLLRPERGSILHSGRDSSGLTDAERSRFRAERVGFVFQDALLDRSRSVIDNVLEGALYRGDRRRPLRARAVELMGSHGLDIEPSRRAVDLSGGQAQRIALCRALLGSPALVLADEPTGNLDDANAGAVIDSLRSAAQIGATVVVATHDAKVLAECDHEVGL
jgi:ABC-type lipoprotein export system ATPase subunit